MPNKQLNLRVPSEVLARIDRLVAAVPGWNRTLVARVAIEEGLGELEGRFLDRKLRAKSSKK